MGGHLRALICVAKAARGRVSRYSRGRALLGGRDMTRSAGRMTCEPCAGRGQSLVSVEVGAARAARSAGEAINHKAVSNWPPTLRCSARGRNAVEAQHHLTRTGANSIPALKLVPKLREAGENRSSVAPALRHCRQQTTGTCRYSLRSRSFAACARSKGIRGDVRAQTRRGWHTSRRLLGQTVATLTTCPSAIVR